MKLRQLFSTIFIFRFLCLFLIQTNYVPDEYYQFSEPAFEKVFDIGLITWEWKDSYQIRSYVPLIPLMIFYQSFRILKLQFWIGNVLHILPRFLQTILALLSDMVYFCLARKLKDEKFAIIATVVNLSSWWNGYMLIRNLHNSIEYCFVILTIYLTFFEFLNFKSELLAVVITCAIYLRPSVGLILGPFFGFSLLKGVINNNEIHRMISPSLVTVIFLICFDSFLFGEFTVPPLNFFIENILNNRAVSFGTSSWHWNFTSGLPVLLGLNGIPFVYQLFSTQQLDQIKIFVLIALSYPLSLVMLTSHQEHRFLLVTLPLLNLLVAQFWEKRIMYEEKLPSKRKFYWSSCFSLSVVLHIKSQNVRAVQSKLTCFFGEKSKEIRTKVCLFVAVLGWLWLILVSGRNLVSVVHLHGKLAKSVLKRALPSHREGLENFDSDISGHSIRLLQRSKELQTENDTIYFLTFDAYQNYISMIIASSELELVKRIPHSFFKYDFDDVYPKREVLIFKNKR
eukprot:gene2147-2288_t